MKVQTNSQAHEPLIIAFIQIITNGYYIKNNIYSSKK